LPSRGTASSPTPVLRQGITTGTPLGRIMVSQPFLDAMRAPQPTVGCTPTLSGHATCCAVGLRTWSSSRRKAGGEREDDGARLLAGMQTLMDFQAVARCAGWGCWSGELVADRATKAPSTRRSRSSARCGWPGARGVFTRACATSSPSRRPGDHRRAGGHAGRGRPGAIAAVLPERA